MIKILKILLLLSCLILVTSCSSTSKTKNVEGKNIKETKVVEKQGDENKVNVETNDANIKVAK